MNVNDENGYILPNEEISHETNYVENEKTDNYNLCNIEEEEKGEDRAETKTEMNNHRDSSKDICNKDEKAESIPFDISVDVGADIKIKR